MDLVWVNGEQVNHINVRDRGLAYGDGLFETMLLISGRAKFGRTKSGGLVDSASKTSACVPLLEYHTARLARGLKLLEFRQIESLLAAVRKDIENAIFHWSQSLEESVQTEGVSCAVLKLIVTRGEGGKGYQPDNGAEATRILQCLPRVSNKGAFTNGVQLKTAAVRLSDNPNLAGIKHLNRLDYILAAQEVQGEALPLLLDQNGYIVESLYHNIFWVEQGRVCTPELKHCGVDGVMRTYLRAHIEKVSGLPLHCESLESVDTLNAKEVFICNSVRGIWPVVAIDKQSWSVGAVTQKLQTHLIEEVSSVYAS